MNKCVLHVPKKSISLHFINLLMLFTAYCIWWRWGESEIFWPVCAWRNGFKWWWSDWCHYWRPWWGCPLLVWMFTAAVRLENKHLFILWYLHNLVGPQFGLFWEYWFCTGFISYSDTGCDFSYFHVSLEVVWNVLDNTNGYRNVLGWLLSS